MSNPNDLFPVPPEGAPVGGHPPAPGQPGQPPPYGAPAPQPPYGDPSQTGHGGPGQPYGGQPQPPYGAPPSQPPYGGPPPYPPGPGAPPKSNMLLYGIIGALTLVIVLGAVLYFSGAFGGGKSRDYSLSAPGQAPALTREFLLGGTWRESCENFRHMEFDHTGNFKMTGPDDKAGYGTWSISGGGASVTVDGRPAQLSIEPLGADTMRVTVGGRARTLIRC